jgi:glycosyltransferase involved in cell wall biosynthesis
LHMRVLWLTQNRPDDISVGRRLIAEKLRADGIDVTQRRTTLRSVLRSLVDARRHDVVVGTTRAGAIAGMVLSLLAGVPLVVDHLDRFSLFSRKVPWLVWRTVYALENLSLRRAAHVLYVYEDDRPRIERYARAHSSTDFGVNYEEFAEPAPEATQRAAERLAEFDLRENVLIYVGGLEDIYHIEDPLSAVDHLEDWTLLVLGAGSKTDLVREAAASRDDVVFVGTVPHEDVPGYVHAADVGIALVDDARTLKVLEYMAAELPAVHLDGEARERFGDVLFYCDADPEDVARAVREAAAATPDAERYRSIARENSWRRIADDYRDAVRTVLADR